MAVAWPKLLITEIKRGRWIPVDGHEKQLGGEIIRQRDCWIRRAGIEVLIQESTDGDSRI